MESARWEKIQALVEAARGHQGDERAAFLDQACDNEPGIREEVESLLAYADRTAGFLEAPDAAAVAVLLDEHQAENLVGQSIGDFELIKVLGYGGMGVVYEAQQARPHRRVALKVARGGAHIDRRHLKLYEREVRVLARLGHPNIAALYEAGSVDDGRHYFAMELVQGVPLNEYVRREELSLHLRVELFHGICDAINYAHQRGVIHRDIKPSNILIDADGKPKVLDFGLAKITDSDVTATTMVTETGKIQGTLAYMSPEQAGGRSDDIDLRSDVYSLGVVLYELLADQLPYDLTRTMLPEAVRVICDEPPEKLSTINRALRGDLETIVGKTLEKEPDRRYQSVAELARDIERYLTDQPILARPPSAAYQFRKLVARHKAPFLFGALLLLALIAFAVVSTVQAIRIGEQAVRIADERDQAVVAREEAVAARSQEVAARQAAEQVSDFLVELFEVADPAEVQGREIPAREILGRGVARIREELQDQPLVQARLMDTMGMLYRGYILGFPDQARELLETALAIRRRGLGDDHLDVAISLIHLATVLRESGAAAEAEAMYREALDIRRRHLGEDHELIAEALSELGMSRYYQGDVATATDYFQQALEIQRRLFGEEHGDIATSLHNLAFAALATRDLETAESMLREALAMNRRISGDLHRSVAGNLDTLAQVVFHKGDAVESEALIRESLAIKRQLLDDHHPGIAHALHNLAFLAGNRGAFEEAESLHREALSIRRTVFGDQHPSVAQSLNELGMVLQKRGSIAAAESLLSEALVVRRALGGNDGAGLPISLHNLSDLLRRQGRCADAEPLAREAVQLYRERFGPHRYTVNALNSLALVLAGKGDYDEAEVFYREALAMGRTCLDDEHPHIRSALYGLAETLVAQERPAEAEPLAIECYERDKSVNGPRHAEMPDPVELLVRLYEAWGKPEKAAEYRALLPDLPDETQSSP